MTLLSPRWHRMLGPADGRRLRRPSVVRRGCIPTICAFQAALDAHIAGETAHFEHDTGVRHKNGTYRRVLCRGVAVRPGGRAGDADRRIADRHHRARGRGAAAARGAPRRADRAARTARSSWSCSGQVLDARSATRSTSSPCCSSTSTASRSSTTASATWPATSCCVAVARRLEACLRDGDSSRGSGGDEFAILLEDLGDSAQATRRSPSASSSAARRRSRSTGHEVFVDASIGIALSTTGYEHREDMLRDADTAMYRAKALGKARYVIFDAAMHARASSGCGSRAICAGRSSATSSRCTTSRSSRSTGGQWTGFEALRALAAPDAAA